jgi:hypothetical protein
MSALRSSILELLQWEIAHARDVTHADEHTSVEIMHPARQFGSMTRGQNRSPQPRAPDREEEGVMKRSVEYLIAIALTIGIAWVLFGGKEPPPPRKIEGAASVSHPSRLAERIGLIENEGCYGRTLFFMGKDKSDEFWSVRCDDGREFMVTLSHDGNVQSVDCAILIATTKIPCFAKLQGTQ